MNVFTKLIVGLLLAITILLGANFLAYVIRPASTPAPAWADIVSGKNHFTTHSADGRIVYLWYYNYEAASDMNAKVYSLGQIEAGGKFVKNSIGN